MTRTIKSKTRLVCEMLEAREVPTVAALSGGVLTVTGTDSAETITVRQTSTAITVDGVSGSFAPSAVDVVWIDAHGGNDAVRLNVSGLAVTKPAVIWAGSGNDEVFGGAAADYLDGGSGNDELHGNSGADKLAGDTGDDSLYGGGDADVMAGGDGDDYFNGSSGNDKMWGGEGYDEISGGTGADHVYDDYAFWAVSVDDSDGYTHHHILGVADNSGFGWFDAHLNDSSVRGYARYAYRNSYIGRAEMIDILEKATDGATVTATEFDDLKKLTETGDLSLSGIARYFGKKVVHGDTANQWFTGGDATRESLGNLYAGAADDHLQKLIDKWFKGADRPMAQNTLRTSTYDYAEAAGKLFVNGAAATDIDQGLIGDCYFLSALGSVALREPSLIQDMFTDNGDGTFTVRFFKDGQPEYVTVDRYLPVKWSGRPVFAGWGYEKDLVGTTRQTISDSSNELWVALAEKAYAQLNESGWTGQDGTNSYRGVGAAVPDGTTNTAGIAFGSSATAMRQITNASTGGGAIWGASFTELRNAFAAGKAITFSSLDNDPPSDDVTADHVYMMTGYNAANGTITLRNPHGIDGSRPVTLTLTWSQIQDNFDGWTYAAV